MKCQYCGADTEGKLFCPNCGNEVQIDADRVLEDEYISSLVGNDDREEESAAGSDEAPAKRVLTHDERTKICLAIIVGGLCFVLFLILLIVNINHSNSYDYQYSKGQKAEEAGKYESAISHYEKAVRISSDDIAAREAMADCYAALDNADGELVCYLEIVNLDPDNVQAYMKILSIYEAKGDQDAILALCENVTDEDVLSIFYEYVVTPPKFNVEGGSYDTYITLELSAQEDFTIYYTSDGSDPVSNGKVYENPIALDSMRDYTIKAVARNDKGVYSLVVTNEYYITIPKPDLPTVTPEDGICSDEILVEIAVQEGYEAHYTWDGSTPTYLSPLYTEPIAAPEGSNILSVIVIDPVTEQYSDIYQQVITKQ